MIAYEFDKLDGAPLIIDALDIVKILRSQGINHNNIDTWLDQIKQKYDVDK